MYENLFLFGSEIDSSVKLLSTMYSVTASRRGVRAPRPAVYARKSRGERPIGTFITPLFPVAREAFGGVTFP